MRGSVGRVPRRAAGVVWEELDGEFLVVVPEAGVVHHLSGDAARVWQACVSGELAGLDEARWAAAVAGLGELGLLEDAPGVPRRTLLVGAGATAVAALGILSVPLPAAADTGSSGSGLPINMPQTAVTGSMITLASMSVISYTVIGAPGGGGFSTHSQLTNGGSGADLSGMITNSTSVAISLAVTVGGSGGSGAAGSGGSGGGGYASDSGGHGGDYVQAGSVAVSGGGGGGSSALVDVTAGTGAGEVIVAVEAGGGGGGGNSASARGASGTLAGGSGVGGGASGGAGGNGSSSGSGTAGGGGGGGTVGGSGGGQNKGGNAGSSSFMSSYMPAVSGILGSVSVTATDNNASGTNNGTTASVTFTPTMGTVTYTA